MEGHLNIVKYLDEKGVDLNKSVGYDRTSPLTLGLNFWNKLSTLFLANLVCYSSL